MRVFDGKRSTEIRLLVVEVKSKRDDVSCKRGLIKPEGDKKRGLGFDLGTCQGSTPEHRETLGQFQMRIYVPFVQHA